MATVYLADDLKHERQVAIKVLLPEMSAAIGADRFGREIRTVAKLQHPHILALFDSGDADGALYFVMPYVDGESLRDLLEREASLPLEAATKIIRQIGDALDYAHAHGVVHRDLKPENILLSGGQALLADFGVARVSVKEGHETLTSVGMTLGTPAYMSPEQVSGDPGVDGRSDLYSLGCIAHELLAGSQPFRGANAMATMAQHITRLPPPLTGAQSHVSEDVVAAVARMMAKDPAERFDSAAEFTIVLETAVNVARLPSAGDRQLRAISSARDIQQAVFVLDFTNIARAPDVDWLCSGIAETVSTDLRKISRIRVVGSDAPTRQRVAAAAANGAIQADTVRTLGRSVGARWAVWGAFQKSGAKIRLTPQFTDVESGENFGVEKIDGSLDEIFELQDRIVAHFAKVLRIELTSVETEHIARPDTAHLSAYELYARGKQAYQVFGKESARAASEYFRQAIAIDPNYALAWAGLGSILTPKYIASGSAAVLDDGVRALQRAMQLDPALGEPYATLAYMYTQQHRYGEAIEAASASLAREPGAFLGWYMLGLPLLARGLGTGSLEDLPRAILPLLRARAINPSFHPAHMVAGWLYTLRGQYTHAVSLLDEAVTLERAGAGFVFLGAYIMRARIHANTGETTAALVLLDLAIANYASMDHVYAETMTAWAFLSRARLAERVANYDGAARDYESARRLADTHDHRLGIGSHWVNATLGLSRMAQHRGERDLSDSLLAAAVDMVTNRTRFVWISLPGCSPAEQHVEVAATHALRHDVGHALAALETAVRFGWADVHQLSYDPSLASLRDSQPVRQLMAHATSLIMLPAPVGSGGFPDLGEASVVTAPSPPGEQASKESGQGTEPDRLP